MIGPMSSELPLHRFPGPKFVGGSFPTWGILGLKPFMTLEGELTVTGFWACPFGGVMFAEM